VTLAAIADRTAHNHRRPYGRSGAGILRLCQRLPPIAAGEPTITIGSKAGRKTDYPA